MTHANGKNHCNGCPDMVNKANFSFEDYILAHVDCEVCQEPFADVDEALDAGTDLYVHEDCAANWKGLWLRNKLR